MSLPPTLMNRGARKRLRPWSHAADLRYALPPRAEIRMIINMVTIAVRQKHYIDRTLESLFNSDGRNLKVNLILGSYDTSHVEKYRNVLNFVPWDEAAEMQVRPGRM